MSFTFPASAVVILPQKSDHQSPELQNWLFDDVAEERRNVGKNTLAFLFHNEFFSFMRNRYHAYRIFSIHRPPPITAPTLYAPQNNDVREDEEANNQYMWKDFCFKKTSKECHFDTYQ